MAKSLNGWNVIYPGGPGLVTKTIPGTDIRLSVNAMAAGLLLYVASRVHSEVCSLSANNLKFQDDGCYAFRPARNSSSYSNHASASAIDLNYALWPQNDAHRSMNAKETKACRKIADELSEVIFWGGNWTREVDEMHWEVAPGVTPGEVMAFCEKHGIKSDGTLKSWSKLPNPLKPVKPAPAKPAKA